MIITGNPRTSLAQYPVFDFPMHRVAMEYLEPQVNQSLGNSYVFALPSGSPSVRMFTVFFETMKYFFKANGEMDINSEPGINLGRLEDHYNLNRMAIPFYYPHPIFGKIKVRYAEPLKLPVGIRGGQGLTEAFSVRLIEEPWAKDSYAQNIIFGEEDFNFPNHTYSHRYLESGSVMPLGGGFVYAVRGPSNEQRVFTLNYPTMLFYLTPLGLIDAAQDPQNNAGRLQAFYNQVKLNRVFIYNHPVYGRTSVRFNQPLKIPEGIKGGLGCLNPFEIELIEVL